MMAITVLSILGITIGMFLVRRFLGVRVCPICAGVSATWLWMVIAYYLGVSIDPIIPAILMGGSIVGIAYQGEKRLLQNRLALLWKTLFIPIGFIAVYSLIGERWLWFGVTMAILIALALVFIRKSPRTAVHENPTVEELEKKMKDCC